MGKPEGRVESYLIKLAKQRGYEFFKFTSPAQSGVPDRCVIGNGYVIFVELKAPGEKPRELQRVTMGRMRKKGANVCTIDTRDGLDRLFRAIDEKTYSNEEFPFDI